MSYGTIGQFRLPPFASRAPASGASVARAAGTLEAAPRPTVRAPALAHPAPWWRRLPWLAPLLPVLAVQTVLSARLVWTDTAFQDEALYLWAGHLEIAHWLHGSPLPAFPTYFSGAPVFYPPLGALADSLGGLAAARLLSLAFMLAATTALWCTANMLFGRRPAFFAAGLWAVLGPTLHLGAFATFDALSLSLLAVAACCAVRAGRAGPTTGWLLAAAGALILAGVAAYSTLLFDPVVLALAAVTGWQEGGWPAARSRLTTLLAYLVTAYAILARMGGPWYWRGVSHTVLDRAGATAAVSAVLGQAWSWTGLVVVLACGAVLAGLAVERTWPRRVLLAVLLAAVLLAPAEQARIHTLSSLDKHLDAGAWFAAAAAGYAVDRLLGCLRRPAWRAVIVTCCAGALCVPAVAGARQARALTGWPDAASFVTWLRPLADHSHGPMLVENPSIAEYYLPAGQHWQRWSSAFNIMLPSGHSVAQSGRIGYPGHPLVYRKFIADDYFSVVALDHGQSDPFDRALRHYLEINHDYRPEAVVPYGRNGYTVWLRVRPGK